MTTPPAYRRKLINVDLPLQGMLFGLKHLCEHPIEIAAQQLR